MRIRMITAEYGNVAKTGGLADMVSGLARWLHGRGHDVEVVLPDYGAGADSGKGHTPTGAACPPWQAYDEVHDGIVLRRVRCAAYFSERTIYMGDARDAARFVMFGNAARTLTHTAGPTPDVIHVHDWHTAAATAITPAVNTPTARSVLTIHNIGYQGIFERDDLPAWTDPAVVDALCMPEDRETVNFLAAGIRQADALTTVSPTHAGEILTPTLGMGLDGLLGARSGDLHGILNGVDYEYWNPATDALIPARYDASDVTHKRTNRTALRDALGLPSAGDLPLVAMITRLAGQKGIDLVLGALPGLFAGREFDCVVLGTGEPRYEQALLALADAHPDRFRACVAHDETLAHRLLAAADILLVPSRYEPCGLIQLYAMRYGTVPVVRATGGLVDTVEHFDPRSGTGTGVVFRDADVTGLTWGLGQALDWYERAEVWPALVRNAMTADFSWKRQGPHYERLYATLTGA